MHHRNLVLCSDGTGNRAGRARGTNVFRTFDSLDHRSGEGDDPGPSQLAIHSDGVGTSDQSWLALIGGAFGYGLARNVRNLYEWLARNYRDGDQIFLFGFSRGAFTVRCLAGMIAHAGIIDPGEGRDLKRRVNAAWLSYRKTHRTILRGKPEIERDTRFRDIHFVGVWDTVDAYGFPIDEVKEGIAWAMQAFAWLPVIGKHAWTRFGNQKPSPKIRHGYHALSIDDERKTFHPVLWDESETAAHKQEIKQVWFAGMHSDVGGGYPRDSLSYVALDWMMSKAESRGLRFNQAKRDQIRAHVNTLGSMHDSRSGLAVYYRYSPRQVAATCTASAAIPLVHQSVLDRIVRSHLDYAPRVLPAQFEVEDAVSAGPRPNEDSTKALARVYTKRRLLYVGLLAWTALLVSWPAILSWRSEAWIEPEWGLLGIGHLLTFLQDNTPELVSDWIAAMRKEPFYTLLFTAALVGMVLLRGRLMNENARAATAAWKHGEAEVAPEELEPPAPAPRAGLRIAHLTGGLAILAIGWLGVQIVGGARVLPYQTPIEAQLPVLPIDEVAEIKFETKNPAQATSHAVVRGRSYRIEILDVDGWSDSSLAADETGLKVDSTLFMECLRWWKREPALPWFVPLVSIGSPNAKRGSVR